MSKYLTKLKQEEFLTELNTLTDALRWLTSCFRKAQLYFGHGTDNAWDEAVSLLKFYFKLSESEFQFCLNARITDAELNELWELVERRVNAKIPLPYLTKQIIFCDLEFYVDERVLIPRSPFAELITNNFSPWLADKSPEKILDLGTGSACIACSCAINYPDSQVWAVDKSEAALQVAKINVDNLELTDSVHLVKSDWFSELQERDFDLIVANPPYVAANICDNLPPEYQHEPRSALYSAAEGLADPIEILSQAADFLSPDGCLFLEVGCAATALEQRFPEVPFVWIDLLTGGEGILMLTAAELRQYQDLFKAASKNNG